MAKNSELSEIKEEVFDEQEEPLEEGSEVVEDIELDEDGDAVGEDEEEIVDEEVTDDEAADEEDESADDEAEDDESIIVDYPDAEGKMRKWEIGLKEIPELVDEAVYGRQAREYVKQTEEYLKVKANAITIGEAAMQDPVMKQVLYWKANGYTDKQIATGLYTYFAENEVNTGEEDELEIDPALKSALEKQIAPLRTQLEQNRQDQQERETLRRNDEVIISSMQQVGITNALSESESDSFRKTFNDLYPGYNTRNQVLTQNQIKVVLRESGIVSAREAAKAKKAAVKAPAKTGAVVRAKSAPKISPAKSGRQPQQKSESKSTSSSAVYQRLNW